MQISTFLINTAVLLAGLAVSLSPVSAEGPSKCEVKEALREFEPRFETPHGISFYDEPPSRSMIVDTILAACTMNDPAGWENTLRARLFSDTPSTGTWANSKGAFLSMHNLGKYRASEYFQPPLINQDELFGLPDMTAYYGYQRHEGKSESSCWFRLGPGVELVENIEFKPHQFSLAEFEFFEMRPVPLTEDDLEKGVLRRWAKRGPVDDFTLEVSSFLGVLQEWYVISFRTTARTN